MSNKIIKLTLMNKNKPIIDFDYDTELNTVYSLYRNYPENEEYAPIGIKDLKIGISKSNLINWFKNRIIPETRNGIDEILKNYNNDYNTFVIDIISKRHGFNLSDQYWFKLSNEDITWEQGNFFTNDFDETTGKNIINKNSFLNSTPSCTTNGNLYKKWIIENNERYLLKGSTSSKQEPYNEVIATKLHEKLLKKSEYVEYELYKEEKNKRTLSKCRTFITTNTEFVSACDIIKAQKQKQSENDYDFFLRCAKYLNIPNTKDYMNKLLVCDYILGNSDRHYNNFGAIRNIETLEYISMCPIFDTGNSLGINDNNECTFTTKPFYKDPKKQLSLVDDLSWLDVEKLNNFEIEVKNILELDDLLSEKYIDEQINELKTRIKDVITYKNKLENINS